MEPTLIVVLVLVAIVVVIAVFAWMTYNNLVKFKLQADESWSGITVQLKRRADLIPNLAIARVDQIVTVGHVHTPLTPRATDRELRDPGWGCGLEVDAWPSLHRATIRDRLSAGLDPHRVRAMPQRIVRDEG